MNLHALVEDFAERWSPAERRARHQFICELRALLEAYGKAVLRHESLPDTEHDHGAPV
ncbi:MAG TPA: hypothetical protein VGF49_12735 [Candidatus Solibacter sp.]|jgi:hypothetical protein